MLVGAETTKNDLGAEYVVINDDDLKPVGFDHIKFVQKEVNLTENTGNSEFFVHF